MKRRMIALSLLLALFYNNAAWAEQVTDLPSDDAQSVGINAGLDSALMAQAVFVRQMGPQLMSHHPVFVLKFTLPMALPDIDDYAFEAALRATVLGEGNLRLQLQLGPVFHSTSSALFTARALGASVVAFPGYQSPRWGLMAEFGYEKMIATQLEHSDLYRDIAFAEAQDGWYAATAGTFRLGLRGGARIGDVELFGNAGVTTTEALTPLLVPIYAKLGASYSF